MTEPFPHALDRAAHLLRDGDGTLTGRTDPAYGNMVGPFGGITAASMLNAALTHPARIGDPVALTVNFAGAIADGGYTIEALPLRTNRSTQHWSITMMQGSEVATSASAIFALRRETWTSTESGFPQVPPASALTRTRIPGFPPWLERYDVRFVQGARPDPAKAEHELDSVSVAWIRDDPPRRLDFLSLAAICDAFFPRIMIRRPRRVPAGTVSITTYFHADARRLAAQGERPVLGAARASHFGLGYHDQSAEIWSDDGALLATSHQIVYYRE